MLLAFPDPDVPRDICTDASNLQSGAAIQQKGNTMAFFSWKLSTAQLKHPTIDEELLCIAQVLEECHSTSWSAGIDVCTNHINLTQNAITSNRIMTKRMLCEEFLPVFHCIEGPDDIEANTLSPPPMTTCLPEKKKSV